MNLSSGKPFLALWLLLWLVALIILPWWHPFVPSVLRILVFLGTIVGTAFFFVGVGLSVAEDPFGIFWSGLNRYSLSRLQMALWTLLIVSALIAVAVVRAWGASPGVVAPGTVATALAVKIPGELLAAMGISYFTGFAAPAALALNARSGTSTPDQIALASRRLGEPIYATGRVIHRPLSADAKMADLVQGDDVATAGTVDLSKVQQLLITLLLLGVYFAMLVGLFYAGGGDKTWVSDSTQLPALSPDFISLMALSHAGYLAYKVAPKSQTESPAKDFPGSRPLPPDRLAP